MKSTVETINIKYLFLIATIIQVFLFGYLLASIYKLEAYGCKCAPDWRSIYILAFSAFAVLVAFVDILSIVGSWKLRLGIRSSLNVLYTLALIVFTYCAITYAHKLKVEKCKCSSELTEQVLYLVGIINAAVLSLAAVLTLIMIIIAASKTK
jgi:hypothetical protein